MLLDNIWNKKEIINGSNHNYYYLYLCSYLYFSYFFICLQLLSIVLFYLKRFPLAHFLGGMSSFQHSPTAVVFLKCLFYYYYYFCSIVLPNKNFAGSFFLLFFQHFKMRFYSLPAPWLLMKNMLLILLKIPCKWQVIFLWLLTRFSLYLWTIWL